MMLFLVTDVMRNHIDITGRNRKRPISILPAETIITEAFFVDKIRRHSFYIMSDFCGAEVRIPSEQYMNVIIGPVDFQHWTSKLQTFVLDEIIEPAFPLYRYRFLPPMRRPRKMIIQLGMTAMNHGLIPFLLIR
jgi:hypothetical protein